MKATLSTNEQTFWAIEDKDLEDTTKHCFLSPFALQENHVDALHDLSLLAQEAQTLGELKDFVDALSKHLHNEYDLLVSGIMPNIMSGAGVSKYTTEAGSVVENKTQIFASLPKEDLLARERALKWINEQGGGGLIKDKLVVESPTQDLIDNVKGKFPMERIQDVHPSSLKAFVSDLLGYKKGSVARCTEEEIPSELHVFVKNTVSVK